MTKEEAIEIYNGLINTKIKEAFEFFAPELRKINEEEIRKDLIGGLMWQRDNLKSEGPHDNNLILPGFCLNVGKHLAYLEKQKESLHIPESCKENGDSFTNDEPSPCEILDEQGRVISTQQKEQKPNYCHYGAEPSIERCRFCSAACSVRITDEQKPAEGGSSEKPNNHLEVVNDLTSEVPTRAVQLPDGRYVTEELARQMAHEGLDEAAEAYEGWADTYNTVDYPTYCSVRDAFKAGAEWAFGQGLVYEGEVRHYGESGDTVYVKHPSTLRKKYAKMFKTGDKVIVQIRKK